jgi:pimeloyl-ACP methyl ester carboxylesterase
MQKISRQIFLCSFALFFLPGCSHKEKDRSDNHKPTAMTDSAAFTKGYSDVNGIKMYYEIYGNGEPLVLIHGGGSTIQTSFGKIIPFLEYNFRLIAVELQGHGHTADRNGPVTFEQDADDVSMLLHNLGIPKASIFGFSNGGNTAMQIAYRHPEVADKLILASAFYKREGMPPGFFEGMKSATIDVMPQALKDAFWKINPDSTRLMNMFTKDKDRMVNFKDWKTDVLTSIHAPTMILAGDRDVMSSSHEVEMSKLILNSRLVILPATHGSYMGAAESPEKDTVMISVTANLIKTFLKNN